MAIKEQGYISWEGSLSHAGLHWLPIFRQGIRAIWKRKFSKLMFFFTAMPFFITLIFIYAISKPELKMFTQMVQMLQSDAKIFNFFYTNPFLIFMLIVLSITIGSDLISADLRFRALPLYFSRPLSKFDYLAGKLSIMLFYLLLFTLVPGILLYIFKLIFVGSVSLNPRLLLGILFYPIVTSVFLASLTLGFSILSANTKLIRILLIIVFIMSDNVAQGLTHTLHSQYFYLFSIPRNLDQVGGLAFGIASKWSYSPWSALALILGLSLGFIFLLYWKIRNVEART